MSDVARILDGSIWLATIDRPGRANALRRQTIRDIEDVVDEAESQQTAAAEADTAGVSGLIVTGGVRRFSAGADLSELNGTIDDLGFDDELERLCRRLVHSPLPVVAAVEGACYGAGVDLAWACDAVVISAEARLALPATSLGILYNPVSVGRLHARLGSPTLRRLMVLRQEMRGRELPSGSATVVQKEAALETAKRLLQAGPANDATAATKALLAALDRGAEIDPAAWQSRREALLASPQRRAALESRRTSITKDRRE